ncbi:MAG: DUF4349 domain-containing protein [Lachnospiraceae bacterium]|nr:DUF4349 domain-containing protein [Lachnospiraceae bacterium]
MMKKRAKLVFVTGLVVCILTGCGGAASSSAVMSDTAAPVANSSAQESYSGGVAYNNTAAAAEEEIALDGEGGLTTSQTQMPAQSQDNITLLEEKLVYHCNLDIETLDYPAAIASIKQTITKYGGVIQSESESDSGQNWYYADYRKTSGTMHNYLAVRIPSKDYETFLAELDGVGKIISKSTSVDNISQQYYDTTAQIEALQIQEKNLLAMLEKCESIEDMIAVEQRLSEVQYELNSLQTTRRYMDMDVAYSYVNISISEVMEYRKDSQTVKRNTFMDRLKHTIASTGRGFLYFLEGLLFLIIGLLPYILIILALYKAFFHKKFQRFRAEQRAKRTAKINQEELRSQRMTQQFVLPKETEETPQGQETDNKES